MAFTEIKSPTECSILMYRDNAADLKMEPTEVSEEYIKQSKALLISETALVQRSGVPGARICKKA